jgi:transcriptional regulator with XRE-family HTH domain
MFNLGNKIKEKRKLLMLTQQELANRCELTKGYISQLENDMVSPSLETLEIILEVLGTTLSEFFKEDDKSKEIVFKEEEQYDKEFDTYLQTWLVPSAQEHRMEPIYVSINPGGETYHDYPHSGEEFGYVIEGEVTVAYGDRTCVCKKGESFYFVSNTKHYLKNEGKEKAIVLWVSCPPNF